jgi:hypothetical protein
MEGRTGQWGGDFIGWGTVVAVDVLGTMVRTVLWRRDVSERGHAGRCDVGWQCLDVASQMRWSWSRRPIGKSRESYRYRR